MRQEYARKPVGYKAACALPREQGGNGWLHLALREHGSVWFCGFPSFRLGKTTGKLKSNAVRGIFFFASETYPNLLRAFEQGPFLAPVGPWGFVVSASARSRFFCASGGGGLRARDETTRCGVPPPHGGGDFRPHEAGPKARGGFPGLPPGLGVLASRTSARVLPPFWGDMDV